MIELEQLLLFGFLVSVGKIIAIIFIIIIMNLYVVHMECTVLFTCLVYALIV